jgi:hypothetical protein
MNVFIGVLLQLHTWSNIFITSTIQLPSEFSSTDCLAHNFLTACFGLFGNTMNPEESVVFKILNLDSVCQSKLASHRPEMEHHILQFLCYSAYLL